MSRYKIRNKEILECLCNYMIDNISNLSSSNNITKYLNSNNKKITDKTISNYIKYLCDAYIFYKVDRFDLCGKRRLTTESKYYLCDPTIKYAKLGTKNMDFGRSYENIVACELLRRGYEIYVGKLYQKEIDFVAKKRNEQIYIQVSRNIDDEYQYEGIKIVDIARWLLDK